MFGFKKKEQKPLWIMAKDVMDLILSLSFRSFIHSPPILRALL